MLPRYDMLMMLVLVLLNYIDGRRVFVELGQVMDTMLMLIRLGW